MSARRTRHGLTSNAGLGDFRLHPVVKEMSSERALAPSISSSAAGR
jgi:hypothetical protein